jgi:asparagine N-glycosylation enzyme membrane subunit Stt3
MAATILIWPGALLHVAILQAAFLFRWLSANSPDAARTRAIQFAGSQAVVAVCVAPFAIGQVWREYGDWSPLVLSNFQPAYFGSAALAITVVQIVHDRSRLGEARSQRILSALTIGFTAVMTMLILVEPLRDALVYAGRWFTGGEALLALVNETRPILAQSGSFDPSFAVTRFGAGFVILPIVWLYLARRAVTKNDAPQGLLLFWALAFFVLTLQQWRFGNTLAVIYAVLIGASLAEWGSSLPQRFRLKRLRPILEVAVVIALMSWSVSSISSYFVPLGQINLRALADPVLRERGPLLARKLIYDRAARWIAHETPKTSGYFDPNQKPEYAVLSDWTTGHLVRYRSKRPVVQDNFGPYAGRENFEAAWNYYAESEEEEAIRILEGLGVRYVIGGPRGAGSLRGLPSDAMAFRLAGDYGSHRALDSGAAVSGLARHRLIFYAHTAPPGAHQGGLRQQRPYSSIGLWEIVPGAQIEGLAEPDTVVRINLALQTRSGPRHVYRRETLSDVDGVYRFVVPYPTDVTYSSAIRIQGTYHLSTPTARGRLAVREADVMAGAGIQGPDLTATR